MCLCVCVPVCLCVCDDIPADVEELIRRLATSYRTYLDVNPQVVCMDVGWEGVYGCRLGECVWM